MNEILASYNQFNSSINPGYLWVFGKKYQQSFHSWYHWISDPKGSISKDGQNYWLWYSAIRKNPPANEKLISMIRYSVTNKNSQSQIWTIIM